MDDEMIERVAKAIKYRTLESDQVADCGLPLQDARTCAIAAIKAMLEPTENMLNAANNGSSLEEGSSAYGCYQDMINAVINE